MDDVPRGTPEPAGAGIPALLAGWEEASCRCGASFYRRTQTRTLCPNCEASEETKARLMRGMADVSGNLDN